MSHGNVKYRCMLCDKLIKSEAHEGWLQIRPLLFHLERHTDTPRFSCDQCDYARKDRSQVYTHIRNKHDRQAKCLDSRIDEKEWTKFFIMARAAFPEMIDWINEAELKRMNLMRIHGLQKAKSLMNNSVHSQGSLNDKSLIDQIDESASVSPNHSVSENQIVSSSIANVPDSIMSPMQNPVASPHVQDWPTLVIGKSSAMIHKTEAEDQPNATPDSVENTSSTSTLREIASLSIDNVPDSTMNPMQNPVASSRVQDWSTLRIDNDSAMIRKNVQDEPNVTPAPVQNTSLISSDPQLNQAASTSAQSLVFQEGEQDSKPFCLPHEEVNDLEKDALREKVLSLKAQLQTSNAQVEKWKAEHTKVLFTLGVCQLKKRFYKEEMQRFKKELESSRD